MNRLRQWLAVSIALLVIVLGVIWAILNPQNVGVNLWGWGFVECSLAGWSLWVLAVGIVVGFLVSLITIIKLQAQLYRSKKQVASLLSTRTTSGGVE